MDDYMIKDVSNSNSSDDSEEQSHSDHESIQNLGNYGALAKHDLKKKDKKDDQEDDDSSHSSDGGACSHQEVDYESQVLHRMEQHYDKNYSEYEVFADDDFINCKIWKLYYDANHDLIYIFIGRIRQLKGKRLVKFNVEHKNMKSQKMVHYLNCHSAQMENFDFSRKQEALEEQVLQVYENCEIEFQLVLQVWNIDDRIMKDKDHRQRPNTEFLILKNRDTIKDSSNVFGQLNRL